MCEASTVRLGLGIWKAGAPSGRDNRIGDLSCWAQVRCPMARMQRMLVFLSPYGSLVCYLRFYLLFCDPARSIKVRSYCT